MKKLDNTLFLFISIILEGYIVLSTELLAMRMTIPFVGTGTDSMSVIIAAVLLPLAAGYRTAGQFKIKAPDGSYRSIRKKLVRNILISSTFLLLGLSYFVMQFFFYFGLEQNGIDNKLIQITIYCLVFLVTPVYLLGQTVPLISNYFSGEKLSKITGKMLFFSTIGSFCGSVLTTLILMQYIGVHHTVSVLFGLLFYLTLILNKKQNREIMMTMLAITLLSLALNSDFVMRDILSMVKNNKYSSIMIIKLDENDEVSENGIPHMFINNNDSSMYSADGKKHDYIEFAERITIEALPKDSPPKDVLIIGAGGFTYGHNDLKNNFVYIDIDKDLKTVSEEHLLKEKIQPNKVFYPLPARAYLNMTDKKFDIILLDAYLGGLSIPEHLVTQEFFTEVKKHLNDQGVLVANFIVSPNFGNLFSRNIDNTFRSVFPYVSRHDTHDEYDVWNNSETANSNFMYIYKHFENYSAPAIYRDNISKVE